MALISRTGILLAIIAVLAAPANGQQYDLSVAAGGPFSHVPALNAPFSADAKTTVRQALPDGTVREHTVTARYYRNSQGHVRAELDTPWGPYVILTAEIHTPDFDVRFVTLDPAKRTYRIGPGRFFAEQCSTVKVVSRFLSGRFASKTPRPLLRTCLTMNGYKPSTRGCRRTSAS